MNTLVDHDKKRITVPAPPPCRVPVEAVLPPGLQEACENILSEFGRERCTARQQQTLFQGLHQCAGLMQQEYRVEGLTASRAERYLELHARYVLLRDRLVEHNMGLVFSHLGKRRFYNVDPEELRSEGLLALVRAVDSFDPWRGFAFSTYASAAILRAFSKLALTHSRLHQVSASSFEQDIEDHDWALKQRGEHLALLRERLEQIIEHQVNLSTAERQVLD